MTRRGFCPQCGSPVAGNPDGVPHIVAIRVASLDDPGWFTPQMDVWTSGAHVWNAMSPELAKFEKYPGWRRGWKLEIEHGMNTVG